MRTDPFQMKSMSKLNPLRVVQTLKFRMDESVARRDYDKYAIPPLLKDLQPDTSILDWQDTDVSPLHMAYLSAGLADTESFTGSAIAEIGCFRGVTTACLAKKTGRKFFAVDPFLNGFGGGDTDLAKFNMHTAGLPNVTHLRTTSGAAFSQWTNGPISFCFIDAVHDYANTAFDLDAWSSLTVPGGIIALHDTDAPTYAGTRRAASEALAAFDLYAHIDNLVMLRKRSK